MMDKSELQQYHGVALAAAGRLRLPLRSRVWRGQAGEFAGSGTGSSMDFQDHREYSPGDDPRHINWQAYARTGSYTMKLFREEVRPVVDLVLDASESMFFDPDKARRTAELFYFLVESCGAAGASLRIHALRGGELVAVAADEVRSHRWLELVRKPAVSTDLAVPAVGRVPLRANAIRVFLSDLLYPGDPDPLFRQFGARHGSVVVFAPFVRAEARPEWSGNLEFIDAEDQSRHPHRIEALTLRRYLDAYANHFALWKAAARRHQAALARIPAEEEFVACLFKEAVSTMALEIM